MDVRLVILGIGLLITSAGFTIYALYMGISSLAGVSLSIAVLGGVFVTIGYTYRDPLGNVLLRYNSLVLTILLKIYEDLELLNRENIQICKMDNDVLVVYSRGSIPCREAKPGLGLVNNSPYMAFLFRETSPETVDPIQIINELGLANNVSIYRSGDRIVVELIGIRRELVEDGWKPLNPIQILVPAYLSLALGNSLVRESEEFSEGVYRATFKVISE